MIAQELVELFKNHVETLVARGVERIDPTQPVAMLFGTDEAQVDLEKSLINIPGLGPIPFNPAPIDFLPEWFALYSMDYNKWQVLMGTGNPFDDANTAELPCVNATVIAAPACIQPNFYNKLANAVPK